MEELYIKLLCKAIEDRSNHALVTTDDFDDLSQQILAATGERLSVSTLKRCFGRFGSEIAPRLSTLSIMSKYLGFRDFSDFRETLRSTMGEESDFKPVDAISIDNMPVGEKLKISWLPNREILVKYLGEHRFLILEAIGTKLHVGDIIEIAMLASGEPMFVSNIIRNKDHFTGYLAGQLHGVSIEKQADTSTEA